MFKAQMSVHRFHTVVLYNRQVKDKGYFHANYTEYLKAKASIYLNETLVNVLEGLYFIKKCFLSVSLHFDFYPMY